MLRVHDWVLRVHVWDFDLHRRSQLWFFFFLFFFLFLNRIFLFVSSCHLWLYSSRCLYNLGINNVFFSLAPFFLMSYNLFKVVSNPAEFTPSTQINGGATLKFIYIDQLLGFNLFKTSIHLDICLNRADVIHKFRVRLLRFWRYSNFSYITCFKNIIFVRCSILMLLDRLHL